MIREIQPDILMNNRLGLTGDFTTPEQWIPVEDLKEGGKVMPWETCMTIGQSWGYYRQDPKNKSTMQLIRNLVDCVSKNGNYLLNVGPTPKGKIQDDFVVKLWEIGKWMQENGESIYGCGAGNFTPPPDARYTQKGDRLFLHLFGYPGGNVTLPGMNGRIEHATILSDGSDVKMRSDNGVLAVETPAAPPDEIDTVIELKLVK
jgi:alpha-L-fucosidase